MDEALAKIRLDQIVEASKRLATRDPRHYALVKMLGEALFRGDFTATELLGALPQAISYAELARRIRRDARAAKV